MTALSEKLRIQPLLIPIKLTLDKAKMMYLEQHQHLLTVIGIDLAIEKRWPCLGGSLALRAYDLQNLIPQSY
ncbi:hypothetical protein [Candidatus Williamhamiltonella defendens]|uniref:hypothetical protein n=1 Tax=Candidatus Williamhamiltonella defendens TaxID=138072 RepID=UPI00130E69DC|nr:hypothetical protein [Candidatus Hamiltonella defensa]